MEDIFEEWHQRDIHRGQLFISDGANNEELWKESKFKILFLLKEAYDSKNTTGTWHLPKHIQKRKATGRTFRPLGQWAYGIQKIVSTGKIEDYSEEDELINAALLSAAIINVKKSSGKSNSNKDNLAKYIESDWDLIEKQISILSPDIIVCGRTWSLIRDKLKDRMKISDRVHKANQLTFVDFWHPANRSSNLMNYYALCALIYKAHTTGKL